ncbi:acyltransferase [Frankia sp. CNm7]|uniref:Acyltransferase n=1 Tax=Frankia nepalensis TaxID=1836974 RepID=A0A937RUF3_9ACTN|nr:acyltransferase [Frankia nepalensis]MBL7497429.1 acyltransferase [Frankia nepalensis]MBL7514512.1 acyltransferase [Frankia nepalensis]MBL7522919.1 acyltransferase [Frankia nepalensis]MBL7633519.1 acyltransferase [Frankia nepalensis]
MSGAGVRQLGRSDDPTTIAVDADTTVVPAGAPAASPTGVDASAGSGAQRDLTVFPGFDGLRAIAAILVVVVHAGFISTLTLQSSLGPYAARAEIGVAVFFLISGFLLYRPFVARHLALAETGGGRDVPDAGGFWIRRFMRIVPLYWLVFVISLVVITDKMIVSNIKGLAQCLLFVQGYRQEWAIQGLTQAWTLNVEVAFYLFVPLYAWLLGRRVFAGRTQLLVELTGVAALYVTGTLLHWRMVGVDTGWADGWPAWLPIWWDLFSMGMFLAVVSAWYGRRGRHPRWSTLPGSGLVCWLLAALCYWAASTRIGLPLWPVYEASVRTDLGKHLFYGLFGFFLLLPAVFGPQRRGIVRRFLASRVMTFLGSISYGIYLWHQTVIDVVMTRSGWKIWQIGFVPLFVVVFGLTVALSALTYYLIERPCQNLAKDWARRWKNRQRRGRAGVAGAAVRSGPAGQDQAAAEPAAIPAPTRPGAAAGVLDETTVPVPPEAATPDTIGPEGGAAPSATPTDAGRGSRAG